MGYLFDVLTRKEHRTVFDDAEWLAAPATGGKVKQWLCGAILASVPTGYGIASMIARHTCLPQRGGSLWHIYGIPALWLGGAWIACGGFIHFRYFWELSDRLCPYADLGKLISVSAFVMTLFRGMWLLLTAGM